MDKISIISKNQSVFLSSTKSGFTIVELLVVIVVIGILASITIISYTGISNKAKIVSLQSDLTNASKQLKVYQAVDPNNNYPTANVCPVPGATQICIKTSGSGSIDSGTGYSVNNSSNPKTFSLTATNGALVYRVTNDTAPVAVTVTSLAISDPDNWLAVGSQVWAKYNLNVGTMVTGVTTQTDNSILEKYCYANTVSNCTNYGALYQWNEAMQYVTTEGAQGICPTGARIPSDNDWKILEMQLGMSQAQADATSFRGSDQGTQLKPGGTSGLNLVSAGNRFTSGTFSFLTDTYLWSSSGTIFSAWRRGLEPGLPNVFRYLYDTSYGFSVRCIAN